MSILEDIFGGIQKGLQKPQSVAMGVFNELSGGADDARDFMRKYEYALVDDTPENAAKYAEAQRLVGSSEGVGGSGAGAIVNPGQLISGAVQGAKSNITPSDLMMQEGVNSRILNPAVDILVDPLNAVGVGGKGAAATTKALGLVDEGFKMPKLAESAMTFGKLGKDAGKADKAAQAARYLYQGMLAGGGDPLWGAGIAALLPGAERGAGLVAGKLFSRAGTQIADDLVGEGAENALSRRGLDQIEEEYQNALRVLGQDMPEAQVARLGVPVEGPGFTMQTRGGAIVPYKSQTGNPIADEARAYLAYNPQADAADMIWDIPGVKGMNQATDVLRLAKSSVDKSGIPLSERGALFNKKLMDDLGWDGQLVDTWAQPSLSAAPTATPMQATTSKAVVPFQEQLPPLDIQKLPESLMAPTRPYTPPTPGALPAAPQAMPMGAGIPEGATSPYVSRPRGVDPDVELIKQALQNAILERNKPSLALNRGMSPQEELLLKLAGGL